MAPRVRSKHSQSSGSSKNKREPSRFDIETDPPKVWRCGNPQNSEYKYPMPEPTGDHWGELLAPLMEQDKIQCDGWKEEVQNLLIFAGLFSAVVTAFVIESYKRLQPDSNADVVNLLSRIANRLDDPNNLTAVATVPKSTFSPPQSAIRLNVFWFLSLVLSLSTVLIGIISLQWLREHQHYQGTTSKQSYAIFHMRAEALDKWYVRKIFTSLPLLLQGALVLFFTGIIDFLLQLGGKVAAPVIVVIALTFLFLISTTLLPTIQAFPLYIPRLKLHKDGAPSQCPYKSPQSQAIRAGATVILWLWSKFITVILYHPILWIRRMIKGKEEDEDTPDWIINLEDIHTVWKKKTWIEFDLAWLDIRDNYLTTGQGIHAAPTFPLHVPLYDLVQGLGLAVKEHGIEDSETFIELAYHCFQEIAQNTHDIHHWQWPYQVHLQALVKRFLKRGTYGFVTDVIQGEDVDLLYDENNLAMLNIMMSNRNLEELVPLNPHFHELQLRILGSITSLPRKLKAEPSGQNFPFVLKFEHPGMDPEWEEDVLKDFSQQWATTLFNFFKGYNNSYVSDDVLQRSFHAHSISRDLIWGVLRRLKHSHEAKIDPTDVKDCLLSILDIISKGVDAFVKDQSNRRPDLLLSASRAFTGFLDGQYWTPDSVYAAMADLSPIVQTCQDLTDSLEKAGQSKLTYISPVGYNDDDANTQGDKSKKKQVAP